MVYCNKKKGTVYYFGANTGDVTGVIRFETNGSAPTIEKQPDRSRVPNSDIMKLNAKYSEKFDQNIFPERISYER